MIDHIILKDCMIQYLYIRNMKRSKFIKTTFQDFLNENNLNDNFLKWFNGSKIIYGSGKALVVYHGSQTEFSEFASDSYFTDDWFNADGYAGGEYVYEVYLSIKNPLILDCDGKKWDEIDTPYGTSTQEVCGNVDRKKYDGIIFNNIKDSWIDDADYQDAGTIYFTFKSNQIKSVDNDGSWDLDDNDINS